MTSRSQNLISAEKESGENSAREAQLQALRRQIERLEGPKGNEVEILSTGFPPLDRMLPRGGLSRGTLVEWLAEGPGSGAGLLALLAAREACRQGRALVVLDRGRQFYPPAAAALGIDLARLLVIRCRSESEELWALDQALRSPGVGAAWAPLAASDVRELRRLQLAAESGGTLGLLLRPESIRGQPSWAEVQFVVRPRPSSAGWRLEVEIARARGGSGGQCVELEIGDSAGMSPFRSDSHETHPMHPAPQLARAAAG